MLTNVKSIKLMTKGAYDLQALRIQAGNRLYANFRNKLEDGAEPGEDLSEEAENLLKELKASYSKMTEGVAKNRTLPEAKGFTGDGVISTFAELVIIDQYVNLEKQEKKQFSQLVGVLEEIPIYTNYLEKQIGIGPAMAAILISYFDPAKAHNVSGFWKYAGLDVAEDGYARSKRKEHLVEIEYTDKNGNSARRMGATFNPWLRTKLLGVLAGSFLRSGSSWRRVYDGYKHRIETDPNRIKITVAAWKKKRLEPGADMKNYWTPGRIHRASMRYMIKMFLIEFWTKWREMEGLTVTATYHEAKMGHVHGGADAAANPPSAAAE